MGQGSPRKLGEQRGANERQRGPLHQAEVSATASILWARNTNGIFIDVLARRCSTGLFWARDGIQPTRFWP